MTKRPDLDFPERRRQHQANDIIDRRGVMLALSSPSGAGKTTIAHALIARDDNIKISISATTRGPRSGEIEGQHYYFKTQDQFDQMQKEGSFLEHATVFGQSYGTPFAPVEHHLSHGHDVLFDIDWQGMQQILTRSEKDLVSVFILPPSYEELERRLRSRAQDDESEIRRRMSRASDELSHWHEYEYVIVNQNLESTVDKVQAIMLSERLKRHRQWGLEGFVRRLI